MDLQGDDTTGKKETLECKDKMTNIPHKEKKRIKVL